MKTITGLIISLLTAAICCGQEPTDKATLEIRDFEPVRGQQFTLAINFSKPVEAVVWKDGVLNVKDSTGKELKVTSDFSSLVSRNRGLDKEFSSHLYFNHKWDELASWVRFYGDFTFLAYRAVKETGAILMPVKTGAEGKEGDIRIQIVSIIRTIVLVSGNKIRVTETLEKGKVSREILKGKGLLPKEGKKLADLEKALENEEILTNDYRIKLKPLWKDDRQMILNAIFMSTERGKPIRKFFQLEPCLEGKEKKGLMADILLGDKMYDKINFFVRVNTDPVEVKASIDEKIPVE